MLVVTRKVGEGIVIGDNIRVTVSEVKGDRVRLGIDAPSDVKIIRNELYYTEKLNIQAGMQKIPQELLMSIVNGSADK